MKQRNLTVSGIAHDLNNQIIILMFALDWICTSYPDLPEARQACKAAEQCRDLVAKLLPDKRDAQPLPNICVRELIEETANLIRCFLPTHTRLEVGCYTDCCIPADSAELHHALVNLCLNAADALNGPGTIRMVAEEAGDSLSLSVHDTGPGVPLELRERVFEPLFTTKTGSCGNGLGLARVADMVKTMNGTITIEDIIPHGACFRMTLPLK
jgi:signal transduction histidine kinase